ncbi:MAG: fibronectin type III domain-containing protein, partial [Thermodesulfobacteriota bacterium]
MHPVHPDSNPPAFSLQSILDIDFARLSRYFDLENSPGWAETQTVPPTNLSIDSADTNGVTVAWTPIAYTGDGGGYRVKYATTSGGPYADGGTTSDKSASNHVVTGLSPN